MKQHTGSSDALGSELEAIKAWIAEHGLALVPGEIARGKGTTVVYWQVDDAGSWRGYLAQAKALSASFVVLREMRLSVDHLQEVLLDAQEEDDSERLRELAESEQHVGHVWAIELGWLAPGCQGVVFQWTFVAPWSDAVFGGDDEGDSRDEGRRRLSEAERNRLAAKIASDSEFQRTPLDDGGIDVARRLLPADLADVGDWELHTLARQASEIADKELEKSPDVRRFAQDLAKDPGFQRSKNARQRVYAAENFLPQEVTEHRVMFRMIVDKALTIFEVDLRPARSPRH